MSLLANFEEEKKQASKVQAEMIRQAQKAERTKLKEKWAAEKLELRKNKKIMKIQSASLQPKAQALRKDMDELRNHVLAERKAFFNELEAAKKSMAERKS